jgi:hypothetical protein
MEGECIDLLNITIDRQISNATRATNGSPVLMEKRQIAIALLC